MPKRKLLGVAAHQIPGRADKREQQHADQNFERERTLDHQRQNQHHGDHNAEHSETPAANRHQRRLPPARPLGRTASVNRSSAKTTMRPESAPINWMPSDSATPIRRLATSAPITLPSVPSTTATNAISTKTCPTSG